jgi:hypothetical protein
MFFIAQRSDPEGEKGALENGKICKTNPIKCKKWKTKTTLKTTKY